MEEVVLKDERSQVSVICATTSSRSGEELTSYRIALTVVPPAGTRLYHADAKSALREFHELCALFAARRVEFQHRSKPRLTVVPNSQGDRV